SPTGGGGRARRPPLKEDPAPRPERRRRRLYGKAVQSNQHCSTAISHKTNHGHRRLLRASRKWPHGRAANERDEPTPLHSTDSNIEEHWARISGLNPNRRGILHRNCLALTRAALGHEHASRMPDRDGASASVTGHDRRSAANWKSVPITVVSTCDIRGRRRLLDHLVGAGNQ